MFSLSEKIGRVFEVGVVGAIGLAALGVVGGMIVYDVLQSPARTHPAPAAAAAPVRAAPIVTNNQSVARVEAVALARGDLKDITLFRTVALETSSKRPFDVVTGFVYASLTSEVSRQFCYLRTARTASGIDLTLTLAQVDADGSVERMPVTDAAAKTMGLPIAEIEESRRSCRFI